MFLTTSLLFKNFKEYAVFMLNFESGDFPLSLLKAVKGNFYLFNEITYVYRSHGNGVYSSIKNNKEERVNINRDNIRLFGAFNENSNLKYNKRCCFNKRLKIFFKE